MYMRKPSVRTSTSWPAAVFCGIDRNMIVTMTPIRTIARPTSPAPSRAPSRNVRTAPTTMVAIPRTSQPTRVHIGWCVNHLRRMASM